MLTQNNERQLTAMFGRLPLNHPARAPYNLFAQSSDTVRSGIVLGLGTRLQVLQDRAVQAIAGRSDIDLTAQTQMRILYYSQRSGYDNGISVVAFLFVFVYQTDTLCRFMRRQEVPYSG